MEIKPFPVVRGSGGRWQWTSKHPFWVTEGETGSEGRRQGDAKFRRLRGGGSVWFGFSRHVTRIRMRGTVAWLCIILEAVAGGCPVVGDDQAGGLIDIFRKENEDGVDCCGLGQEKGEKSGASRRDPMAEIWS
jgi:hypothetical protein